MSEIIKLYENAEIVPKKNCYYWDCPYSTGNVGEDDKKEKDCENCNNPDKKTYPPFTAEKQIELIKWLLQNKRLCIQKAEYSNNFYMDTLSNRLDGVDNKDFEQCLGSLVNNIWQSLAVEEKQQIKEILE